MSDHVHILAALSVCLCLAASSGCAEIAGHVNSLGSRLMMRKSPEEALNIKTPADRIKELKALAKAAGKKSPAEQQRVVDTLARELQQENEPLVRRRILRTLAEYPQPAAAAVIVAALSDSDIETRRTACTCLGTRGGKESVAELSRVLSSDTDADVRIAAVRALGNTNDASALPSLAEAIIDPDPAMQDRAHEALTAVSGRDYGNNVQAWREYAKSGKTDAPEISLAERLRRSVF